VFSAALNATGTLSSRIGAKESLFHVKQVYGHASNSRLGFGPPPQNNARARARARARSVLAGRSDLTRVFGATFAAMTAPIELRVGGKAYRVHSSESAERLRSLAQDLDARVEALTSPGKQPPNDVLLLAALGLLHDLYEARESHTQLERRTRDLLRRALARIDQALEAEDAGDASIVTAAMEPENLRPNAEASECFT
jgi:cell division protein ZapA (FtsZ GTPase activity inhibitor)